MKKQIFLSIFIFQFFIFLIPSISLAQNSGSQVGCISDEGQQHAPWWGWTPAHDHLSGGDCSSGATSSNSSAQTMSSAHSSDGCKGSGQTIEGDSSYKAWWGWTNVHDHMTSGTVNCGDNGSKVAMTDQGPLPENILIIFDEAKAFKAEGKEGHSSSNYEIDLNQIKEKPFKMRGVQLAEISEGKPYMSPSDIKVTVSNDNKAIISGLKSGKTYALLKSQDVTRVLNTYDMLCAVHRVRAKLKPESIDPICAQILCSPDFIESSLLFEKFSELAALKGDMQNGMKQGGSISNLQLGGLGLGSKPGGRICNKCTQFAKSDVVIPSQDCGFKN